MVVNFIVQAIVTTLYQVNVFEMPTNIEIKAILKNRSYALEVAKKLSQSGATVLKQQDTFYNVPNGRLKLRVLEGEKTAQLISYSRPDVSGPKRSDFSVARTENPEDFNRVLTESLGVLGYVKKTRLLFLVGQTRVHIDTVEGLGDFLELEVLMKEDQSMSDGERIAQGLMNELQVSSDCLIAGAYMDLILANRQNGLL